jgi:hypothetical protein
MEHSDEEAEVPNTPLFVLCMLDDLFKTFGAISQVLEENTRWSDTTYVTTEGPRGPVHWEEPDEEKKQYTARYLLSFTRLGALEVQFDLPDISYARPPVEVRVFFDMFVEVVPEDKEHCEYYYHLDRVFSFRKLQEWTHFLNTDLKRMKADAEAWVQKREAVVEERRKEKRARLE